VFLGVEKHATDFNFIFGDLVLLLRGWVVGYDPRLGAEYVIFREAYVVEFVSKRP
jgi:hypothetical protein